MCNILKSMILLCPPIFYVRPMYAVSYPVPPEELFLNLISLKTEREKIPVNEETTYT